MAMSAVDMQYLKDMTAQNNACIALCKKYLQASPADRRAQITTMAQECITEETQENADIAAMMKAG